MKRQLMRIISAIISLLIISVFINTITADKAYAQEILNRNSSVSKPQPENYVKIDIAESYDEYLTKYSGAVNPQIEIGIDAADYSFCTYIPEILENFQKKAGPSVLTTEDGYIEWKVIIDEAGFYNMGVDYYPISGKSSTINRTIMINGELVYEEARSISFYRVWTEELGENGKAIQQDRRNNDIKPSKKESPIWQSVLIRDSVGSINEPLKFYFQEGVNTIRFVSIKEPMLINKINLYNVAPLPSYADIKATNDLNSYKPAIGRQIKFQAEEPHLLSDPIIQSIADRSTPSTEPNDPSSLRLNSLGAQTWQQNGQWVEWDFDVENEGLYNIGIKAIQNTMSGSFSSRRIYIDGIVPFKELDDISYQYSTTWSVNVLGGTENPYEFYFTKGRHKIRIEATLGSMSELLKEMIDITNKLNSIYRKILVITGPIPDYSRDYQFEKAMPDVLSDLKEQSKRLLSQIEIIKSLTGLSGENAQLLNKIYMQTSEMADKPDTIPERFTSFQINISSLGTWISTTKNQPLTLDYFVISPINELMPAANADFIDKFIYAFQSFVASFFQDYSNISDSNSSDSVKVWVGNGLTGGRDQAQLLKAMADNTFTTKSNVQINLQLVAMGALLPATLANIGPDVALTLGMGDPVNYACRHAVVDLTQFADYSEISKRFNQSSIDPLQFENGVYGLPETVTFPMLFYRKDIMQDLKLAVPQTWDDVITMLPVLQKNQLNFSLPPAAGATGVSLTAFATFLYQNGGQFYKDNNRKSDLDSQIAIDAFTFLTSLYTDYNIPVVTDFVNRFRTGDTPIGISDFGLYNQLSVFAPELNGLWGFTELPGIKRQDGTINRAAPNNVSACIILKNSMKEQESWEFLKWWTSAETQITFGREIESIMGPSARYPTANLEALYQIPWSKVDFDSLMTQGKSVFGIPQVPGGYYTSRYLDFSFRSVINNNSDPGESLLKAVKTINSEIEAKRKEFGLEK